MSQSLNDLPTAREYLRHIGAEVRGLWSATVCERDGRYSRDRATIRLTREGAEWKLTVRAADGEDASEFEPPPAQRQAILFEAQAAHWPEYVQPHSVRNLPPILKEADPENIFEFRNEAGDIVMLQLRGEVGKSKYRPFTYWSDNQWRQLEPEGMLLPLWGLDQLGKHGIVFLHEGAKAARSVRRMVEAASPEMKRALAEHPWGKDLQHAAHLGWIGGAPNPHRTDWEVLARAGVTEVFIVADNDRAGLDAVPRIARALAAYPITVHMVRFDKRWPSGFDLADPFPPERFEQRGDGRRYKGPPMSECIWPATWATRAIPTVPTGRRGGPRGATYRLRSEFAAQWITVNSGTKPTFHPERDPARMYDEAGFNMRAGPFSDHPRPAELFKAQAFASAVDDVTYNPSTSARIINVGNRLALNLYTPSPVLAQQGDAGPWLDFLKYLIPSATERGEVERWLATLVAHPGVRMKWGLLLASTMQGVGKTTLCEIMRKLVGERNTSSPTAQQLVNSQFNDYASGKRLIYVNEIYAEKSWAAYNNLKSIVTDPSVEINKKYLPTYTLPNWAHFILCSNSTLALPMEEHDRRWFAPEVTEETRPPESWRDFYAWLEGGGYGIIRWWAEHYEGTVGPADVAPWSRRKDQMIADSRTAEEVLVRDLAAAALAQGGQVVILEADVVAWLKATLGPGARVGGRLVRTWLKAGGLKVSEKRLRVDVSPGHVATTVPLCGEDGPALRPFRQTPVDLMGM
jgi:hypothetical protein